jgi:hypothetical protein
MVRFSLFVSVIQFVAFEGSNLSREHQDQKRLGGITREWVLASTARQCAHILNPRLSHAFCTSTPTQTTNMRKLIGTYRALAFFAET